MKNILLIEKDDDIRYVLEIVISELGLNYYAFKDSKAFAMLEKINPSIIVMDILKNGGNIEFCKLLKNYWETKHIPVFLTGVTPGLSQIADECGADGYIEKPFELSKVEDLIRTHI